MPDSAFQLPLVFKTYDNQSLFSDHYLDEILQRNGAVWLPAVEQGTQFLAWLRAKYAAEKEQLHDYKESQLEDNWFQDIFKQLGHVWEVQAAIPGLTGSTKKPDYAFFPDEASRKQAVSLQNSADYAQAAIAVGEVKQWGVNLSKKTGKQPIFDDQNPMFQIDTYLTLTGLDWGILSNGRYWRLVNRNSSRTLETYFEIDLLAALEAPDEPKAIAVAAYFWLFFNQASFCPDTHGHIFLDEAVSQSRAYAIALEADLRDNAYRSLEQLIIGFFAGDQSLDKDKPADRDLVYQNSLYLLYRLLFLFYGESRGLLPMHNATYKDEYSLQQLAKSIDKERNALDAKPVTGRKNWNRLGELCRLISGIDPQLNADLNVPRYNGGLFDPQQHPFLEQHFVGDRSLAKAIDYLAVRRIIKAGGLPEYQAVDYSTLDVRQLGSIYEGLLEYKVVVAAEEMVTISQKGVETWAPLAQKGKAKSFGERRQPGDLLLMTDKGERKATGSYYTPDYIVEYIVENTLGPLVAQAREQVKTEIRQTGSLDAAERDRQSAARFVAHILKLNVLDPAMGSGHFLVEATSYLARALATDDYVQVAPSPAAGEGWGGGESDLLYWKRRVVEACIYGVDKNPMAVELAKLSLWLKTASADKPLSFLDHHLRHGDSLIGAWLKDLQTTPATRHAPPATSDQSPLFNEAAFTLDAGLAVKGVAVIEGLPTLDIDDVHAKEAAWRSIQQTHIAHWQRLADLWVSAYFGNSFTPPEYRALAARLQKQESLMSAEQAAHFLTHPAVTDNDYFHWELAFPEVFFDEFGRSLHEAAGFDALIGNPPYIRSIRLRDTAPQAWSYYPQAFSTASQGEYDIYICFVEQGTILLRKPGEFGFILPNKWFNSQVGKLLRKQLADHKIVSKIVDFGAFQVFAGVTTYTCLLFLHQGVHEEVDVSVLEQAEQKEQPLPNGEGIWQSGTLPQVTLAEKSWNFSLGSSRKLLKKLNELSRLQDIATVFSGAGTRADPIFQMQYKDGTLYSRALEQKVEIEDELMKPSLTGRNIDSYSVKEGYSLLFPYRINERKVELISSDEMANNYPRAWAYLNHPQNQETLKSRDKGAFYEREDWFGYGRPQNMHLLGESKIVFPDVADKAKFAYDQTGHYIIDTVYAIQLKDNCKILLATLTALLNSTVMTFFLKETGTNLRGGYFRMKTAYLNPFPIPTFHFSTQSEQRLTVVTTAKTHYTQGNHPALLAWTDAELAANRNDTIHDLLAFLAEQMITLNKEKQAALEAFWLDLEGITDAKTFDTLRNKGKQQASLYKAIPAAQPFLNADSRSSVGLDASLSWNEEAFKGFVKALAGSVSGLSKVVQVYRDHASGVAAFEQRLTSTDHLIDQIVYKLYGLTAAEIAIVEGRQS